jgi:hypothetical protein
MHHGRTFCEVGAQADSIRVGDADTSRNHVVDHARKLVDPEDSEMSAAGAQPGTYPFKPLDGTRTGRGPNHVGERAEDAVEVDAVGSDQAMTEKVQPEVGVGGASG